MNELYLIFIVASISFDRGILISQEYSFQTVKFDVQSLFNIFHYLEFRQSQVRKQLFAHDVPLKMKILFGNSYETKVVVTPFISPNITGFSIVNANVEYRIA